MSLKTCKILQTIAVVLFALAFLIVLLSVPMKNTFISLAYPNHIGLSGNMDALSVNIFPMINFIAALVYLVLSLVHFYVLKKPDKKHILISIIVCSAAFFIYKLLSPALNDHFTERAFARGKTEGSAYYNVYGMLENALYSITAFLTVPGSILMFLSFGGSIGKGAEEKVEAAVVLPEAPKKREAAIASEVGANASEASAQAAASPLQNPSDGSPFAKRDYSLGKDAYYAAFKRPEPDSAEESEKARPNDSEE